MINTLNAARVFSGTFEHLRLFVGVFTVHGQLSAQEFNVVVRNGLPGQKVHHLAQVSVAGVIEICRPVAMSNEHGQRSGTDFFALAVGQAIIRVEKFHLGLNVAAQQ